MGKRGGFGAGFTQARPTPKERYRGNGLRSNAAAHLNQKPLALMRRMIRACTDTGDVVWEPFGVLCTGSAAAVELKRRAYAAEKVTTFADIAEERLTQASKSRWPPPASYAISMVGQEAC